MPGRNRGLCPVILSLLLVATSAQAAPPTFQAFSAIAAAASGGADPTVTLPAHAANDIFLLATIVRSNTATVATPAGWTQIGTPTVRSTVATYQFFWKRAAGSAETNPLINRTGTTGDVYAAVITYRGAITTGDPWEVKGTVATGTTDPSVITGITTLTADSLVVVAVAGEDNNNAAVTTTATNPAAYTEHYAESATGADGVITFSEAARTTTGATGNVSVNWDTAVPIGFGGIVLALKPPVTTFDQSAYRLFNNSNSTDVGAPLAAQDTAATLGSTGAAFRLRMLLHVAVVNLAISGQAFKLQFVGKGTGTCAAPTGGTPAAYTDVTAATIIAYNNNATPADGAALTANASDPTHGGDTVVNQTYEELNNFTNPAAINIGRDGKWDLALKDNGAAASTTYCFRVVKDSGAVLDTYLVYPEITTTTPPPPPGGFNAYETSTAPGAITGVIKTKIAGSTISLDMIALNVAKAAIETTFAGTVRVEVLNASDNSGALDANSCRPSWTVIQTLSPDPAFTDGRDPISFTQANSYPNARLRITFPAGAPTVTGCSNDNFAIRPNTLASFAVTDTDWQTAGTVRTLDNTGAAGGNVHKAGRPFTVRADAVNGAGTPAVTTNYTGTPAAVLSDCGASSACLATFGTFTLGASFVAGQLTSSVADYIEAGSFALQLVDATFASVDNADSTPLEREITSGAAINVGRFVPDHFDVTSVTAPVLRTFNDAACATRSFTYIGQRFGYATIPAAMIAAKNSSGGTTSNYTGALWKLTNASASQTFANSPVMPLDTAGIAAPTVSETAGTGTGTYAANASDAIAFVRDNATPQAPFNSNLSLTLSVSDAAEAGASQGTIATATPLVFNGGGGGIAFDSGAEFRYGQARLANASGPGNIDVPIALRMEYRTGTGFAINVADHCTAFVPKNFVLSGHNPAGFSGSMVTPSAGSNGNVSISGNVAAGVANLRLLKPSPAFASPATVRICLDLDIAAGGDTSCQAVTPANKLHLQGRWSGANYDKDPGATATFGLHGQPRNFIFFRENY